MVWLTHILGTACNHFSPNKWISSLYPPSIFHSLDVTGRRSVRRCATGVLSAAPGEALPEVFSSGRLLEGTAGWWLLTPLCWCLTVDVILPGCILDRNYL